MSKIGSLGHSGVFFSIEFLTLEEAVEAIERSEDEYDVVVIPPENDQLSDEDNMDDNHNVIDVAGTIELVSRGKSHVFRKKNIYNTLLGEKYEFT